MDYGSVLVHDLAALRCPEWFDRGLARAFRAWFDDLLPLCDTVFAASRATAADVTAYAREIGVTLSRPVMAVPLGNSLSNDIPRADHSLTHGPQLGSYVLFVSTIEARKNHLLLFRLWRRMLDEMPRDQVPTLVFAGRIGWMVDDLMQQIINTEYLFGRLVLIENASDAELAALYRGCLFTVYPSFHEGWGLPVTESLAFGKPCLISDRTSCGAGANLGAPSGPRRSARMVYRRPSDPRGPSAIGAMGTRIKREFKPAPWSATVHALLAGLRHPLADSPGIPPPGPAVVQPP